MIRVTFLTLVFIILTQIIGCNSSGQNTLYFTYDEWGNFYTNDVQKVQDKITFQLILPTYLPEDLVRTPYMVGIANFSNPEKIMEIASEYHQQMEGGIPLIMINQSEMLIIMNPEFYPWLEFRYQDIFGVQVIELDDSLSCGSSIYQGLEFIWNQNQLSFSVRIYKYDHNEAIKIIESMIEQMQPTP